MRDLAGKWPPVPEWDTAILETDSLRIRTVGGLAQLVVSGDLQAWGRAAGMAHEGVGAFAVAQGPRYAVRVARDRILAVSETPFGIAPGWHGEGFAVSGMDAAMHVFEIAGAGVPKLLARATALDPTLGPTLDPAGTSASAALLFAGVNALAYRHGGPEMLRVHVDRGLAPYLWKWFEKTSFPVGA